MATGRLRLKAGRRTADGRPEVDGSSFGTFPVTVNNQLRTGADKGNPTV